MSEDQREPHYSCQATSQELEHDEISQYQSKEKIVVATEEQKKFFVVIEYVYVTTIFALELA